MNVWNWASSMVRPVIGRLDARMSEEAAKNAGQSAWDMHLHRQEVEEANRFVDASRQEQVPVPAQTPPPKQPAPLP